MSGERAQAQRFVNEIERIERQGVLASKRVAGAIRQAMFRSKGKIDIEPVVMAQLKDKLRDAMIASHLSGIKTTMSMQPHGEKLELGIFDTVVKLIKKKLGFDVDELNKQYDTQAFKILKDASKEINAKLAKSVDSLVTKGTPTGQAIKLLGKEFEKLGLTPKSPFQLETIFRTQASLAYSAGRWQADQDPDIQEILWGYKYVATGDDRVRPEHEALDGTTLPKDDPFWNRFFPPNGWNCRCQAISIYESRPVVKAPTHFEDGSKIEPDKGFNFNPGAVFGSVELSLDYIALANGVRMGLDPNAFRRLLRGGPIYLSDVKSIAANEPAPEALALSLEAKGIELAYNPDQPRDGDGQWVEGAGGFTNIKTKSGTKRMLVLKHNKNGTVNLKGPKGKVFKNVDPETLTAKASKNHIPHPSEEKAAAKGEKKVKIVKVKKEKEAKVSAVDSGPPKVREGQIVHTKDGVSYKLEKEHPDGSLQVKIIKGDPYKGLKILSGGKPKQITFSKPEFRKLIKEGEDFDYEPPAAVNNTFDLQTAKGNFNSKQNAQAYKKMAAHHKESVKNWCQSGFINIRKGEQGIKLKNSSYDAVHAANEFNKALDTLPKYKGDCYRGMKLSESDSFFKSLGKEGGVVKFNSSQSTSRDPKKAAMFAKTVMMKITSKTGVSVEHFAKHNKFENEVVARKDSKYRIKKVHRNVKVAGKRVKMFVEMEEI